MRSHQIGNDGEDAAAVYLQREGYEIMARKYRKKGGEIDIICCKADDSGPSLIVFVEVKTRRPTKFGRPEQAVSRSKMRRIYRIAEIYLHENPHPGVLCRFDVMAVYWMSGRLEIEHFIEAFGHAELMDMD